ncbi:hypothetical protein [Saccharothrix carnea]|uniref:hypothetical protein n=1 Tax=Saccharothrix TaxID=2071 RepID=UPI000A5F8784
MTSFDPIPWEQTTAIVLAQQPPSTDKDPGGQQEDFGKSSPLGLLILVLFFIAVFFLVKSMNKHLKKLPASFDQPDTEAKPDAKAGNGNGGVKKDD